MAVGIDVGGTKLAAGLVAVDGTVMSRVRETTPAEDADAVAALVCEVVATLRAEPGAGDAPVGIGAAGLVDLDGVVRYGPNVRWGDHPLQATVAGRTGAFTVVHNDADAAAWAEHRVGAGKETDGMVMLTIGTGIGGGLVEQGRLVRGASGMAAEFGHIVILEGGPPCPCGNHGCLEALASGTAIGRTAAEMVANDEVPTGSDLRALTVFTGKSVTLSAHAGDAGATEVLRRCGSWLGVGIASLVNALDPALVVVGGGAMQAGELLLEPARQAYHERLMGRGHRDAAPVVAAQLGDDAGVVGAGLLAMEG